MAKDKYPAPRSAKTPSPDAEETAIAALGWLAGKPELMDRFLALSGLSVGDLRAASSEPDFLAGLLGFLTNHEPTLMAFCADTGMEPEIVCAAERMLARSDDWQHEI
ncbi:DUF3572 domain-containing protein [Pararhizobium mangrovi]|uniref:DUF3572 family protein n=1 Tax=Pararhizobium mangrovi TaxID=2590452 RepID=A0A506TWG1_9HYPH|nr:DUF3572 domain-containing protein [Pararhizobium mangrovi]TPW25820.1 DUF3572 family protein [Pararhizobium mangrovi]